MERPVTLRCPLAATVKREFRERLQAALCSGNRVVTIDRLLCFAKGRPGAWEAICIDLDIAVQGETREDTVRLLELSIAEYLASLDTETPDVRARLLRRRAPLAVRAGLVLGFLWHALTRRDGGEYRASYELPCPA